jgi:hypothetical protein
VVLVVSRRLTFHGAIFGTAQAARGEFCFVGGTAFREG